MKAEKQKFDIGQFFTIQYFAKKHDKIITRKAKWTEGCYFSNRLTDGVPYVRYFDIMQNDIRCATSEKQPFAISEVK